MTLSGCRKSLRILLSWHNPLLRDLNILGTIERSPFYTGRVLSRQNVLLEPSAFLRPLFRQVVCYLSNRKLLVYSNCFLSSFPTHRRHLSRVKFEQGKVLFRVEACIRLMQLWQGDRLARFLLLGFGRTWLLVRWHVSAPDPDTSSSFLLCTRSLHLPN